jgi:hypothetical protein
MPLELLERRICELAVDIDAATCRWLLMVAEFDRRGGHEAVGFHSCTGWLAWHCGLTARAAREQVRVARALSDLPRITAAFAAGRLSYSKARALTRVATPEMEDELLELAQQASASQLESMVRGLRRGMETADPSLALERRYLSTTWEPDGMMRISGALPAEEGELVIKAIEAAREGLRRQDEGSRPDRADGLTVLAETLLAQGPAAAPGGERNQVVVHIDADRLVAGREPAPAKVGAGGAISGDAAQRIACDASVVTLIERAGEPLSVGRKTRAIPPAIERALRARDRGCRFPGCEHERYVDAHHIVHWAHGGETSLDNLVLLCRRHHTLLHEGGASIERAGGGDLVFRRPDGREVGAAFDALPPRRLRALRQQPVPSSGERLDLHHAVWALAARAFPPENAAQTVSGENVSQAAGSPEV